MITQEFFSDMRRQKRSLARLNEYFDNEVAEKKNKLATKIEFLEMPFISIFCIVLKSILKPILIAAMSEEHSTICNEKTFEQIYKTYAKEVRRFLFFKTQNTAKAEDIMQDTFIKLWDNCKNVDSTKLKSYLFTVANNMFLNQVKHEKVVTNFKKIPTTNRNSESPEFVMIEKEFLDKLNAAISALPERQKEVFLLSRMKNKKYKEIAELLNISQKAVEKRMHLALLSMRAKIGNV